MIRVYTAQLLPNVAVVKAMLESQQIPCVLRNEHLASGIGELPLVECWPELWVVHDYHAERARALVEEYMAPSAHDQEPPWQCAVCHEMVDAVFARCWNCQAEQP